MASKRHLGTLAPFGPIGYSGENLSLELLRSNKTPGPLTLSETGHEEACSLTRGDVWGECGLIFSHSPGLGYVYWD